MGRGSERPRPSTLTPFSSTIRRTSAFSTFSKPSRAPAAPRLEGGIPPRVGIDRPRRLAGRGAKLLLSPSQRPALLVAEGDGPDHHLLRHLLCSALPHQHRLLR